MRYRFSRKNVVRSTALSAFVLLVAGSIIAANHFNASAASKTLTINTSDIQKPLADCIVEGYGHDYGLKKHTGSGLTISTTGEGEDEVISITYDDAGDYYLECSDKGLTSVASINLLSDINLFWVDLSDNPYLVDIRGLSSFGNIDTINLSNTGIRYSESTLEALSGHDLKRLYLENANVDNEAITALGNNLGATLKSLDLSNNDLVDVSGFNPTNYIRRFGLLEELNLDDNNLGNIEGLENLTRLKMLYVNNNALDALAISNNKALEYVEASNNVITSIDVSTLTNLESIDLSFNNLTTAAGLHGYSDSLASVKLFANNIEDFDDFFDYYSALYDMQGNQTVTLQADSRNNIELPASVYDFKDTIGNHEECDGCTIKDDSGHITISVADGINRAAYTLATNESNEDKLITVYIDVPETSYIVNYSFNGGEAVDYPNGIQDNGTSLAEVNTIKYGSETVSRNGYTFLGWSPSSSALDASYQKGDTIDASDFNSDGVANLYAVWSQDQPSETNYSITYNVNGGDYDSRVNPGGNYIFTGTNLSALQIVKGIIPNRSGYTFKGWSRNKNAVTASYEAGDTIPSQAFSTNGNKLILYAVWWKDATPDVPTQPDTCSIAILHYKVGTTEELAYDLNTQHYCGNITYSASVKPELISQGYTFASAVLQKTGKTDRTFSSISDLSNLMITNDTPVTTLIIYYNEPASSTEPDRCSIAIHNYKVGSDEELDIDNAPSLTHYCGNFHWNVDLSSKVLDELGLVFDSAVMNVDGNEYPIAETQFPFEISNNKSSIELTIYYKEADSDNPEDDDPSDSGSSSSDSEDEIENVDTGDSIIRIALPGVAAIFAAGFALIKSARRN